ncbi:MAG: hypothetical protein JKY48_20245 [Flavobacteriales bacterium]|nr:hypothetical protein [Flavobacteriales bacterium]
MKNNIIQQVISKAKFLFLFFILLANTADAHKFYMSITDMQYNSKTKSLQVVIKLFVDDIESVLEKENNVRIFFGTDKEHQDADKLLQSYLNSHFIIEQSRGSLSSKFVGKEVDKDYLWVYLEFEKFKVKDESTISNSLLIRYFSEQTNKVNYQNGAQLKSFTLHKNSIAQEF